MSTIFKNFDFNPIETKVVTTNYTIPAGRYAFVKSDFPVVSYSNIQNNSYTVSPLITVISVTGALFSMGGLTMGVPSSTFSSFVQNLNFINIPNFVGAFSYSGGAGGTISAQVISNGSPITIFSGPVTTVGNFHFTNVTGLRFNASFAGPASLSLVPKPSSIDGTWVESGAVINIQRGMVVVTEYNQYN